MMHEKTEMLKRNSFSELAASSDEVASLAKHSETDSEAFTEFSLYVEKLSSLLETITQDKVTLMDMDTPCIRSAIMSLQSHLTRARTCVETGPDSTRPNKLIQDVTHDLGRSLGLLLFASIGVSLELKDNIGLLHKEMMNAKFYSPGCSSEEVEIEEHAEVQGLGAEEIALQLKYGNEDEFRTALLGLDFLIRDQNVDFGWISDEGVIPILFNRLGSTRCKERLGIIKVLRRIISCDNDQMKEKMADMNSLTTLVKSLARDEMERRETVGLLGELANIPSFRRRIGRIQGCIVMLVAILNGDDQFASCCSEKLLSALACNTQNALLMAEAGYFQPLIHHLRQGSEMSKILMATALSRMELSDKIRDLLGQEGAIGPLVTMFKTGKLEAKLSALSAVQNLSISAQNISNIINSGILSPLIQLLFSVTSSLMTLREPASAILAKIAQSEAILDHEDLPEQLLSLLNLSNVKIKHHLLIALNTIASHANASDIRNRMGRNGVLQLLFPFLIESNTEIRLAALNLLYTISKDTSADFTEIAGENYLRSIVDIISSSSTDAEKAAAASLLSNIPVTDAKVTDILKRENLLPLLVSLINSSGNLSTTATMCWLGEGIAGIFVRFTLPSDKKLQLYATQKGVIPVLVKLISKGSIEAKYRAAISLNQLSQNCLTLRKHRDLRWVCVPSPVEAFCEVHDGYCTTKGSFCLVKAGAVTPLINVLEGEKREADEAVLSALATLLNDNTWENGSNYLAKISGGVKSIVRVIELGTPKAKETALWILERIFRIEDHRLEYGRSAQMVLINLAQRGEPALRPRVAKLLAQLEVLQDQSSYF